MQRSYLHHGGVAAGVSALQQSKKRFEVANRDQIGMAGTLLQGIMPNPGTKLASVGRQEITPRSDSRKPC